MMHHRLHTRWFKIVLATRALTRKRFSVSAPSPSHDRLSERGTSTIAACVASWCATPAPTTASPCREWASWRRAGSATGAFTGRTRPGRYNSVDATACCVRLAEVLYLETNLKKKMCVGRGVRARSPSERRRSLRFLSGAVFYAGDGGRTMTKVASSSRAFGRRHTSPSSQRNQQRLHCCCRHRVGAPGFVPSL